MFEDDITVTVVCLRSIAYCEQCCMAYIEVIWHGKGHSSVVRRRPSAVHHLHRSAAPKEPQKCQKFVHIRRWAIVWSIVCSPEMIYALLSKGNDLTVRKNMLFWVFAACICAKVLLHMLRFSLIDAFSFFSVCLAFSYHQPSTTCHLMFLVLNAWRPHKRFGCHAISCQRLERHSA